jgi:hypothetical protein
MPDECTTLCKIDYDYSTHPCLRSYSIVKRHSVLDTPHFIAAPCNLRPLTSSTWTHFSQLPLARLPGPCAFSKTEVSQPTRRSIRSLLSTVTRHREQNSIIPHEDEI